ncbi:MAG TPA: hypothetical protein VF172_04405 [Nitrososphaera sp.]
MKYLVLIVPVTLLFLAVADAYATSFSFNPSTGELYGQIDIRLPAAIVAVTSAAGVFLIINERRKAKGIWFSDSGRLK